jgi:hypothetical protein
MCVTKGLRGCGRGRVPLHNAELLQLGAVKMDTTEIKDRDNLALASSILSQILTLLQNLSGRERARVLHSLLDYEAKNAGTSGYQNICNFVNDRLLAVKGAESAASYWLYLADMSTNPKFRDEELKHAVKWVTVPDKL